MDLNQEKGLVIFDRLRIFDKDFDNRAIDVAFNFIEKLHGFDDAEYLARSDGVAYFDKRLLIWAIGAVERADKWCPKFSEVFATVSSRLAFGCRCG